MKAIVFSPHTDDAIFSIGAYMSNGENYTIVSVFAGVPEDEIGKLKHTKLREEHEIACNTLGTIHSIVNSDFLDDVYSRPDRVKLKEYIKQYLVDAEEVYIPLGIHHPDHVMSSCLLIDLLAVHDVSPFPEVYFYEELPYRVDYPDVRSNRFLHIENTVGRLVAIDDSGSQDKKREAVLKYKSQVDNKVLERVMVTENIWKLIR